MMRLVLACLAALTLVGAGEPVVADEKSDPEAILELLPDGPTKEIFGRLPSEQQRELGEAAIAEAKALPAQDHSEPPQEGTPVTQEPAEKHIENSLAVRMALIAAAYDHELRASLNLEKDPAGSADLLTAALSRITLQTQVGKAVQGAAHLDRTLSSALLNSPYVWRPRTPCSETVIKDPLRLTSCIDRQLYKSVVGIAWTNSGVLEIWCTGQMVAPRILLTADHCFDGHADKPVILTHFDGGGETALRKADDKPVAGVRSHPVAAVFRGTTVPVQNNLRGFDVAVVELTADVGFKGFPVPAKKLPIPLQMTVAGWGASDVAPVNAVALEVSVITPEGRNIVRSVEPTMLAWPAGLVRGGGICRADSGGPVFSGSPGGKGTDGAQLLGLVAGGNPNCKSGDQVITDLTRASTIEFVCKLDAKIPFCRRD